MTAVTEDQDQAAIDAQNQNGGNHSSPRSAKRVTNLATGRTYTSKTREKDNGEYFAMMERMLRAATKRVKAEDPSTLADFARLVKLNTDFVDECAKHLHDVGGWSWGEIGYEFGIGRHAARKRWGQAREQFVCSACQWEWPQAGIPGLGASCGVCRSREFTRREVEQ